MPIDPTAFRPTSVRLDSETLSRLDSAAKVTKHTRTGLISYAINSFLDFYERTGNLPPVRKIGTKSQE
jgi:predicted transcriptional regulator